MSRHQYDEEASAAWHMDVVHEVDDSPHQFLSGWMQCVASTRSTIRSSASSWRCTATADPVDRRSTWGCETTELIADHFGVEYPRGLSSDHT
jgi:hypothetical protein